MRCTQAVISLRQIVSYLATLRGSNNAGNAGPQLDAAAAERAYLRLSRALHPDFHGSADALSFRNAIGVGSIEARKGVPTQIANLLRAQLA